MGGGAYFPKNEDPHADGTIAQGQPWTATTWSLNALREWGVPAAALTDTADRLARHSRWEYDDLPYWGGEVDVCINGFTLANGAWLGADVRGIAQWFLDHEMAEGGWNCEWVEGSTRASVHSTMNALWGILTYERSTGGSEALRAARLRAQEYLLGRQVLYRRSGGLLSERVTAFGYPFRWPLTALRALDYFRTASVHDGVAPDPRLARVVEVVRSGADAQGRWTQGVRYPGKMWFEVDVPVGEPSPWLTFFARRGLEWWDAWSEGTES